MKAILFFSVFLFIISCSSKDKIPADIIAPQQMQSILWDMLRADEFVLNYTRRDSSSSLKDKSTRLYTEVFKIHKTNRSGFEKSIDYYNLHPDVFKIVLDSLDKKKAELNIKVPYQSVIADSLRKKIKSPEIRH